MSAKSRAAARPAQAAIDGLSQRPPDTRIHRRIAEAVEQTAHQFGRDRIAVVLRVAGHRRGGAYGAVRKIIFGRDFHYRQREPGNLGEFIASALGLTG